MDIETDIIQIEQGLEQEIQDNIMSKTMPKMKFWQKVTSSGKKEQEPMTAKKLKQMLDMSIKEYLQEAGISKIPMIVFTKAVLTKFDQTILSNFKITLYKNGKTTKVKSLNLSEKLKGKTMGVPKVGLLTEDVVGVFTQEAIAPWSPSSKKSKQLIMEGKLKQVVYFHVQRKHALEWEICLACKAIRAFVQWEFHQPMNTSKKKLVVTPFSDKPNIETITAKPGEKSIAHAKINQITTIKAGEETIITGDTPLSVCYTDFDGKNPSVCSCGELEIIWNLYGKVTSSGKMGGHKSTCTCKKCENAKEIVKMQVKIIQEHKFNKAIIEDSSVIKDVNTEEKELNFLDVGEDLWEEDDGGLD